MHPRISLSAISTFSWSLDEDLAFYDREGVQVIGLSLAKMLAAGGWEQYVDRIRDRIRRQAENISASRSRRCWRRIRASGNAQ